MDKREKVKFDKYYYENYAKQSLCRLVDPSLTKLEKSEKPDWIMPDFNLGVEVTRAIPKKWAETDSIIYEYLGKGLDGEYIIKNINRNCKRGFNAKLSSSYGHLCYSQGCIDYSIYIKEIESGIIEKERKLANYAKCNNIWLYIFVNTFMMKETDIEKIISGIEYTFEKLFINDGNKLFIIDKCKMINVVEISESELKFLRSSSTTEIV